MKFTFTKGQLVQRVPEHRNYDWVLEDTVVIVKSYNPANGTVTFEGIPSSFNSMYFTPVTILAAVVTPTHDWVEKRVLFKRWSSYHELEVLDVRDNGKAVKIRFTDHREDNKPSWITVDSGNNDYQFISVL